MNIFSVLDSSDNEEEQPKVVPQKKGGKETGAAKPAAKPADKKEAPKAPRVVPGLPPKENKNEKKAAAAPAAPKEEPAADAGEASKSNARGGLGRGKGRDHKGDRNTRRAAEADGEGKTRPKREFDRRSGTGRGREVSRGGRGSYGAGSVEQDALDAEKHPQEAQELLEPVEQQPETVEGETAAEPEPQPEPVPSVFTLDEFLEKREQARARLNDIVGDKPVRTVDKSAFGNLEPKNDTDLDSYMPATKTGKAQQAGKKDQRSSSKAQVLDLGFKSWTPPVNEYRSRDRPERERGERSGRGAGRGEGRRHEKKNAAAEAPAVVFDAQDFPSL